MEYFLPFSKQIEFLQSLSNIECEGLKKYRKLSDSDFYEKLDESINKNKEKFISKNEDTKLLEKKDQNDSLYLNTKYYKGYFDLDEDALYRVQIESIDLRLNLYVINNNVIESMKNGQAINICDYIFNKSDKSDKINIKLVKSDKNYYLSIGSDREVNKYYDFNINKNDFTVGNEVQDTSSINKNIKSYCNWKDKEKLDIFIKEANKTIKENKEELIWRRKELETLRLKFDKYKSKHSDDNFFDIFSKNKMEFMHKQILYKQYHCEELQQEIVVLTNQIPEKINKYCMLNHLGQKVWHGWKIPPEFENYSPEN